MFRTLSTIVSWPYGCTRRPGTTPSRTGAIVCCSCDLGEKGLAALSCNTQLQAVTPCCGRRGDGMNEGENKHISLVHPVETVQIEKCLSKPVHCLVCARCCTNKRARLETHECRQQPWMGTTATTMQSVLLATLCSHPHLNTIQITQQLGRNAIWRGPRRHGRSGVSTVGRLVCHTPVHTQPNLDTNDDGYDEHMEHIDIMDGEDGVAAQPSSRPRITTPFMTKYERARILGTRALQIR